MCLKINYYLAINRELIEPSLCKLLSQNHSSIPPNNKLPGQNCAT